MATPMELLSSKLSEMIGKSGDFSDISKEDFHSYLSLVQSSMTNIVEIFSELSKDECRIISSDVLSKFSERTCMYVQIYKYYIDNVAAKASRLERDQIFSSFINAADSYSKILDGIDSQINALFDNKVISLYNLKLSQVAVCGILQNCGDLYNFIMYLAAGLFFDTGMDTNRPPKYRFNFLNSFKEQIVECISNIYNETGDGAFLKEIRSLKSENKDITLVNENNEVNDSMIAAARLNRNMMTSVTSGFISLNIFRWIGEAWNSFRDSHYRNMEEKKEWMQTHIQLLKLRLQGMNSSDKQYQKLQTVIQKYDDMVAEADEKIRKYRES